MWMTIGMNNFILLYDVGNIDLCLLFSYFREQLNRNLGTKKSWFTHDLELSLQVVLFFYYALTLITNVRSTTICMESLIFVPFLLSSSRCRFSDIILKKCMYKISREKTYEIIPWVRRY